MMMRMQYCIMVLLLGCLLPCQPVQAIEALRVQVQGTNALVSWASEPGDTYIVRYRTRWDASSPWLLLTNGYPAATGTNRTTFIHEGIVEPGPSVGGGSGGPLPTPSTNQAIAVADNGLADQNRAVAIGSDTAISAGDLFGNDFPPLPWDERYVTSQSQLANDGSVFSLSENTMESSDIPQRCIGFYQVVREGLFVMGLTNQLQLSGSVSFPVEIGVADAAIAGVSVYASGLPLTGTSVETNDNSQWFFNWDTRCVPNGVYTLGFEGYFTEGGSMTNQPVSVSISNLVSFPDCFTCFFGDALYVCAQLGVPDAHYVLLLKDSVGQPLCYFEDDTHDGNIFFGWDLSDGQGGVFTNEVFAGEFYISPIVANRPAWSLTSEASPPSATFRWVKEKNWLDDKFIIAYTPKNRDETFTMRIKDMVAEGVVDGLWNYYTLSPGNVPYSKLAFCLRDAATRDSLLNYLADPSYRNFYFCGHGSPTSIGGIDNTTLIDTPLLRRTLKNYLDTTKATNSHPYTFVFIDACSTGAATFCELFGIPSRTVDVGYFSSVNMRARAFLGFKRDTMTNKQDVENRANMLGQFFWKWIRNVPLQTCVESAAADIYAPLDSSWVIYGATNLTYSTF